MSEHPDVVEARRLLKAVQEEQTFESQVNIARWTINDGGLSRLLAHIEELETSVRAQVVSEVQVLLKCSWDGDKPDAMAEILAERKRQIEVEGWTSEHDDQHDDGSLLRAANMYYLNILALTDPRHEHSLSNGVPVGWPWKPEDWKPKNPHRDLVRAGALCLAEKERLARQAELRRQQLALEVGIHHRVKEVRPETFAHVDHKLGSILKLLERYP